MHWPRAGPLCRALDLHSLSESSPEPLHRRNFVSPFHKWGIGGSKKLRSSPQVTQLESSRWEFPPGSGRYQDPAFSLVPHSCSFEKWFQCHISLGNRAKDSMLSLLAKGSFFVEHSSPRTYMAPSHPSLLNGPLFPDISLPWRLHLKVSPCPSHCHFLCLLISFSISLMDICIISWGCYNEVSQTGQLKTIEIYSFTFWSLEVQGQDVGKVMLSRRLWSSYMPMS